MINGDTFWIAMQNSRLSIHEIDTIGIPMVFTEDVRL